MTVDFEGEMNRKIAGKKREQDNANRLAKSNEKIAWMQAKLLGPDMLSINEASFLDEDAKEALRGLIQSNLAAGRNPEPIVRSRMLEKPLGYGWLLKSMLTDHPKPMHEETVTGWLISLGVRVLYTGRDVTRCEYARPVIITPDEKLACTIPTVRGITASELTAQTHYQALLRTINDPATQHIKPGLDFDDMLLSEGCGVHGYDFPNHSFSKEVVSCVLDDLVANGVPWVKPK